MLIDRRSILILLAACLFGAGSIVTAQEAQAAPSGRVYVGCGKNYNHCVALRRAYVRDGGNHMRSPALRTPRMHRATGKRLRDRELVLRLSMTSTT